MTPRGPVAGLVVAAALLVTPLAAQPPASTAEIDWAARYDGPAAEDDRAIEVLRAADGDALVVGTAWYDLPGGEDIEARITAIRYDPTGRRVWTAVVDEFQAAAFDAALAPDGGVVIWGRHAGTFPDSFALARVSADGVVLWSRLLTGDPTASSQVPTDVAIDPAGAIYAVGRERVDGESRSLVYKVLPDGTSAWSIVDATFEAVRMSAAVADDTAVFVTGQEVVPGLSSQLVVRQVLADGSLGWSRTYGGEGPFTHDGGNDLVIDGAGHLVVCGYFNSNTAEFSDLALLKLTTGGDLLWQRLFDSGPGQSNSCYSVAVDGAGRVAVAGLAQAGQVDLAAFLAVYEADGTFSWSAEQNYDGEGPYDSFGDVTFGPAGEVYVTGSLWPSSGLEYLVAARYAPDGELDWNLIYPGPVGAQSSGASITVDRWQHVVLAGRSLGPQSGDDMLTLSIGAPLFADGFESGDLEAWAATSSP